MVKQSIPVSHVSVTAQISMCSDITRSHIEEILLFIERAFHKANRSFGPKFERADFSGMDIILLTIRDDAVDANFRRFSRKGVIMDCILNDFLDPLNLTFIPLLLPR